MRERGFMFLLVIVLLASAGALMTAGLLRAMSNRTTGDTLDRKFARAHAALVAFAAQSARLPCPAQPTANSGDEVRAGSGCTYTQGTLPWRSLGLRQDDGYDPWGWKISYRVYTGAAGSLTQDADPNACSADGGASMVCCEPTETQAVTAIDGMGGGGFCKQNKKTPGASFLAGKGFSVNDFGTVKTGVAYVLISHGPTGYGGYTIANQQLTLPANANELSNTGAGPTFFGAAASASTVGAGDPMHFDDVIAYATISDVIAKAGRGERCWSSATPHPPPCP